MSSTTRREWGGQTFGCGMINDRLLSGMLNITLSAGLQLDEAVTLEVITVKIRSTETVEKKKAEAKIEMSNLLP